MVYRKDIGWGFLVSWLQSKFLKDISSSSYTRSEKFLCCLRHFSEFIKKNENGSGRLLNYWQQETLIFFSYLRQKYRSILLKLLIFCQTDEPSSLRPWPWNILRILVEDYCLLEYSWPKNFRFSHLNFLTEVFVSLNAGGRGEKRISSAADVTTLGSLKQSNGRAFEILAHRKRWFIFFSFIFFKAHHLKKRCPPTPPVTL